MRSVAAHNQYVSNQCAAAKPGQETSRVMTGRRTGAPGGMAVAGLDLGTSGVKVVITSPDGLVLGRASAGYPVSAPAPGRAEADPGEWWQACCRAVRAALADAGRVQVTALGLAGQMHGVVLSEADGRLLRPAILWLDQRATTEAASYAELPEKLTAPLGNRPSPGMAGPILAWLARHEPFVLRAAWWALQPKDWLRLRLTGAALTDPTDASGTLLFDLTQGTWSEDLIAALNLPPGKFPPVRESTATGGRLLPGPARDLGLPPGIPVAVGAADTAAALYAAALRDDEALLTLGSGGQWVVPVSALPAECLIDGGFPAVGTIDDAVTGLRYDRVIWEITLPRPPRPPSSAAYHPAGPPPGTNLYRAVGGTWYRLAPVQNVGVTLDWVRHLLGATWDDLYDTAALPPRPGAPSFQPWLTPERWDPHATGAWTGLTLAHQREDLLRSALDGVAALLRHRLDDLRAAGHHPSRVILAGGGTAHPAWRALLADTLGIPLIPAPTSWLTPLGAARLASVQQS